MPRRAKTKRIPAWIGPRTVPVRSGHEGKKAPESPTPKPIPTRCEPGRFAVRNSEHRTSAVQHPISKGAAKPPKATSKPYSRHILGIDSGVQSHTKGTSKPTDSQPIGTPKPHQCDPKATPRLHQSHPKATPRPGRRGAGPTLRCGGKPASRSRSGGKRGSRRMESRAFQQSSPA